MAKGRKPRQPQTLLEKVDNKYPNYSGEVLGLSVQQLEQRMVSLQKQLEDSEAHKESNFDLKKLKEQAKDAGAAYREVKTAVSLKTKLLVSLIREKGGQ